MTPFDLRSAAKSAGLCAVLLAVGLAVTTLTDEGGLAWTVRIGRTAPAAPLAVFVAVAWSASGLRRRGDWTALAAAGVAPWRAGTALVAGAALPAALVAAAIGAGWVDAQGFFPRAHGGDALEWDGGRFVDVRRTFAVAADGTLSILDPAGVALRALRSATLPRGAAAAAAGFVALASTALGWGAVPVEQPSVRATGHVIFGVAALFVFHAVASGRLAPWTVVGLSGAWLGWSVWMFTLRERPSGEG